MQKRRSICFKFISVQKSIAVFCKAKQNGHFAVFAQHVLSFLKFGSVCWVVL